MLHPSLLMIASIIPLEYEEQLGDSTTLIQNIIDDQRDNVNNLIDRSNFSSALTALTVKEYISIDNDGISEIPIKEEYVIIDPKNNFVLGMHSDWATADRNTLFYVVVTNCTSKEKLYQQLLKLGFNSY
ncbi:14844_t:CDS:2 [Entrophospora sp. SA101]|nr:14844_t:CDS:2 [Entrophospora sp. SA101]